MTDCAASTRRPHDVGVDTRVWTSWRSMSQRSRPAPVSTFLAGRSVRLPSCVAEVLHEHEVPELDVAVARPPWAGPPSAPHSGPQSQKISEHGPHGPVSPISQKLSLSRRWMRSHGEPDLLGPDRLRLVVADVDGDPDAVAVEAQPLGDELPRPRDGVGLEVVAEAEVAEHLEEAEVARRAADRVEVVVLAGRGARTSGRWRPGAGRTAPAPRRGSTGRTASSPSW